MNTLNKIKNTVFQCSYITIHMQILNIPISVHKVLTVFKNKEKLYKTLVPILDFLSVYTVYGASMNSIHAIDIYIPISL